MALAEEPATPVVPEVPAVAPPPMPRGWLSPLNRRRLDNFRRNRRALWSFWIFAVLFGLSLFAEFLANDKPIVVNYRGELRMPIFSFYSEREFGGDFQTEAPYGDPEVICLILTGGVADPCFDAPDETIAAVRDGTFSDPDFDKGWIVWPLVPYSFTSIVDRPGVAPGPPNVIGYWEEPVTGPEGEPLLNEAGQPVTQERFGLLPADIRGANLLGTDDTKRDVLARVIYGFRLSVLFTLIVTTAASIIGIIAGAIQGFFGGWTDLLFQRFIEIWGSINSLYVIIILFAILDRGFWILAGITVLFSWTALVGLVRAEFLRARNFEYVRAAQALGMGNTPIMFRHILPNAMVATITMLPFLITGGIATLAGLDFLGYGLPSSAPSLGEMTQQAKQNLQAPWLGFTAFFTLALMLTLLVFIFEGVRDAFDPRKTFSGPAVGEDTMADAEVEAIAASGGTAR